jgi:hypothetical protein
MEERAHPRAERLLAVEDGLVRHGLEVGREDAVVRQRVPAARPAAPFPPSIFLDKNRRDVGKSQSIWTDSKMETAGSQLGRDEDPGRQHVGLAVLDLAAPLATLARHPARVAVPPVQND